MNVLRATGLTKVYKGSKKPALDDLSLEVDKGQIFTLLGRNGAGKTTFLRIAGTQLLPTSGSISVLGFDAVKQPKEIRKRIAFTPQEAETIYPLTPRDHIMLSLRMRGMRKAEAEKRSAEVMRVLELTEAADTNASWLSGGMKQRVIVAMTIATDAELLFLDEPSIGLDPVNRRKVWEQLTLIKQQGRTVVLTTHYMDEAEALSDNLAIIDKGKIVAQGTPQSVKQLITSETNRVEVYDKFEEKELAPYGRVVRIAGHFRVLTDAKLARDLSQEALARGANVSIGPVALDDIFVDIVGEPDQGGEDGK
ncbi:MAG TPA: ABC transporter ATP-binding protein [Methanomassiliicoccales archaeon]|nr:ABC transporter ATP-binding protein [Methanomassiliicoccales archaeon]